MFMLLIQFRHRDGQFPYWLCPYDFFFYCLVTFLSSSVLNKEHLHLCKSEANLVFFCLVSTFKY